MNDQATVTEPKTEFNAAREAAELIPVEATGVAIQNFAQQVDIAKWMAGAGFAVSKDLRNNVGACLAVIDHAQRWGFSPYQVARLCYSVNGVMGFEAQLQIAVVNRWGGLKQRLRPIYEGEGDERVCIIRGHFEGELDPVEYRSPPIGKIQPKNSPLWKTDPDQQLFYYSGRAFARRYCSHVIMGIYGRDELMDNPHIGAENAKDITDALGERLKAAQAAQPQTDGFHPDVVKNGLADEAGGGQGATEAAGGTDTAPKGGKRTHKPREAKAAKAAAEPEPNPAEPTTPAEYCLQLREAVAICKTPDECEQLWENSKALRRTCGIKAVGAEHKAARAIVDERKTALVTEKTPETEATAS